MNASLTVLTVMTYVGLRWYIVTSNTRSEDEIEGERIHRRHIVLTDSVLDIVSADVVR